MADIRDVNDKGEVINAPQETQPINKPDTIDGSIFPELEIKAIGSIMGLERDSELGQYKEKINTLIEYAKSQTTDHSLENLKQVIRHLQTKLGSPPIAEKLINYISRYAYLLNEEIRLKKQRETFERKPQ
jgi:hypothetical protein